MSEPQTPQQPQPQNDTPPSTGTWLKLDARDPEAEAAEKAYLKESARVRRGVWIGNFVMGLLVAGVLAGLGYVFIPKLGKPAGASAAQFIGTDDQRQEAATVLAKLNGAATMWKLQHYDRLPDFERYPDWEQFIIPTDTKGFPIAPGTKTAGTAVCGPYANGKPVNPINNLNSVWQTEDAVAAGSPVGGGKAVGFVYNRSALKFYVTDVAGTRVIDPSAAPEAVAGVSAADAAREREATEKRVAEGVETFREKLRLYQSQHNGGLPDFEQYPGWDQLTKQTDNAGRPSEAGQHGPYLEKPIKNPHTGTARVQTINRPPGARFRALSASVGYVMDASSGKVWAVNADGELLK